MSYFSIFRIIASALLFIAILDLPYGYYTLLRIVVTAVAGYGIYAFFQKNIRIIILIFSGIAVIFNPLIPVHLEKETWQVINVVVGSFFLISLYYGSDKDIFRDKTKEIFNKILDFIVIIIKITIPLAIIAGLVWIGYSIYKNDLEEKETYQREQIRKAREADSIFQENEKIKREAETRQLVIEKRKNDSLKCIIPYKMISYNTKSRFFKDKEKVILFDVYGGPLVKNDSIFHGDEIHLKQCSKIHVHHNGKASTEITSLYSRVLITLETSDSSFVALMGTYNKNNTCHACGLLISAVFYTYQQNQWNFTIQDTVGFFGSFGHLDDSSIDTVMFGDSNIGFKIITDYMAQGTIFLNQIFLAFIDDQLKLVWYDVVSESNVGNCNSRKADCYEYDKSIKFINGENEKWYDLEVVTQGTEYSDTSYPLIVNANKNVVYRFNGEKYSEK